MLWPCEVFDVVTEELEPPEAFMLADPPWLASTAFGVAAAESEPGFESADIVGIGWPFASKLC